MHCESESFVKSVQFVVILLVKLRCRQILVHYFVCHSQVQVVAMHLQQSGDNKWDTCVEMLAYTFVYKAYG